jgi:ATP-dependent Clp protease, protease subunit
MTKDTIEESYNPGDALKSSGIYVFMDEVNSETIKPVLEWILYENYISDHRKKELLLMICSEGGDLSAAFALIDTMKASQIPIKTVGLGLIASCGLLIFIAGTRGRRVLTPNTSILSHQFSAGSEGKAHDLFATVKEFELTQTRMINHYKTCTGLDEDTIREKLLPAQDVWLDGPAAIELGLCDAIAEHQPVSEPVKVKKTRTTLPK